jgi:hypothetical protein
VPVVLVANIPNYGEEMTMTAKMINVEDGSLLWMGSGSGKTEKTLATIFGALGGAVVGATVAGGDSDSKVLGGIVGGVVGGVAGRELTPQQAEQVQKIIKQMCKSLPPRYAR